MKQKQNTGFTLIELLVVIAIIGILASTVLLALNSSRRRSRDTKRLAEVKQISTALEVYLADFGGYPDATVTLVPDQIEQDPIAPIPADGSCTDGPTGTNTYTYTPMGTVFDSPKDNTTQVYPDYTFSFCIGGDVEGTSAGPHTLSPSGVQ